MTLAPIFQSGLGHLALRRSFKHGCDLLLGKGLLPQAAAAMWSNGAAEIL